VPYRGALAEHIHQLVGGLRSGMGYVGAADVRYLRTQTKFLQVTHAGLREGHVHDVFVTDEAPNYPIGQS
jgi:IMP dehydrogenase